MENRKIICDNMIWYHLGANSFDIYDVKKMNLIGTYLNMIELLGTEKWFDENRFVESRNEVINAIKAFYIYAKEVRFEPPLIYLIKEKVDFPSFGQTLFSEIIKIADGIIDENFIKNCCENKKKDDFEFTQTVTSWKAHYLKLFGNDKEFRKTRKVAHRGKRAQLDSVKSVEQIEIVKLLNHLKISWDSNSVVDFTNHELFLKARVNFIKQLELSNDEIDSHDYYDLHNFIYVAKNEVYWTCENWQKDLFKQINSSNYLFQEIKCPDSNIKKPSRNSALV